MDRLSLYENRIQRRVERNVAPSPSSSRTASPPSSPPPEESRLLSQLAKRKANPTRSSVISRANSYPRNLIFQALDSPAWRLITAA